MEDTRSYILATSFRIFMEKGYKNTTMSQLVTASKVSKGAFYHYFPSKEALFDAAIDTYFFALASPVVAYQVDESKSFLQNVVAYLQAKQQMASQLAKELSLAFNANYVGVLLEAIQLFEHHKRRSLELLKNEITLYEQIIQNGQQKGEIKPDLQADLLAKQFYFMLDGFELHTLLLADLNESSYAFVTQLFEQFYTLIKC